MKASVAFAALAVVSGVSQMTLAALPSNYRQLEYVELTGSQYFSTGQVLSQDPGYEVDFKYYTPEYVNDGHVFGTSGDYFYACWSEYNNSYWYGGGLYHCGTWNQAVHTVVYNRAGDNAIVLDGAVMVNDGNSHYSPNAAEIGKRGNAVTFQGYIYYFKIIDHQTGQAVVDLVPVRCLDNDAVGFYDLAKGVFVPPVGEGVKPGPEIAWTFSGCVFPSDYRKIEYVELTGSQYFSTGQVLSQDPGYEVDFKYYTPKYVDDGHVFGTPGNYSYACWSEYNNHYWYGGGLNQCGTWNQAVHTVVYNRAGDNAIVLDGAVMVNDGNSHYSPYVAEIGKRGTAVTFQGYIYYFKIIDHQTGQAVVDLVPVRRVSDNAVGFYDLAKGAFVPPVGEGVKPGPDDFSIPDQTFTGEVVCPQVSVLLAGSDTPRLVPDEEFSVCYSNNVSMGVASVTVTGKGRAETHTFRIIGPASVGLALGGDFAIKPRRQATRFAGVPDIKVVDREGVELDPSLYTIGYAGVDRSGTATAYAKINGGRHTGVLVARTFPVAMLPSKYSLLEWVGLDGTQYFNTGVVPLADPGYEISFDYYTTEFVGGDGGFVFATAAPSQPWKYAHWTEYNGNYTYGWNGDGFTTLNITCEQKRHSVVYNRLGDRAIVLDGAVKDSTNRKYGSTSTVQIGRREKSATYKGRIYSFMIRQHSADNSYASILVPAMRKSDQAVGFYDAVADEFIVPEDGRTAIPGPVRPLCGLFLVVQ